MNIPSEIVRFCAEEVERQRRGPIQVADMVDAWVYTLRHRHAQYPSLALIQECGRLVEPTKNDGGWRGCGVRVGDYIAPSAGEVPGLMARWHGQLSNMTPGEAYREFEEIHPFGDGNGRVGKIIFNWLNRTLDAPVMPPNYFGCINY